MVHERVNYTRRKKETNSVEKKGRTRNKKYRQSWNAPWRLRATISYVRDLYLIHIFKSHLGPVKIYYGGHGVSIILLRSRHAYTDATV